MKSHMSLLIGLFGAGLICTPALAQAPASQPLTPRETRLSGLSAEEAAELLAKIKMAQDDLRRGASLYFELLSGAPAAYPMTTTPPREAFLSADFSHPFDVTRLRPNNPSWKPYRLTLLPNGPGNLLWDVQVVLGSNNQIERVEMFYRPPHPF